MFIASCADGNEGCSGSRACASTPVAPISRRFTAPVAGIAKQLLSLRVLTPPGHRIRGSQVPAFLTISNCSCQRVVNGTPTRKAGLNQEDIHGHDAMLIDTQGNPFKSIETSRQLCRNIRNKVTHSCSLIVRWMLAPQIISKAPTVSS